MENPDIRLLVVDDDEEIRELLTRYLNGQGYCTEAVHDGTAMDERLSEYRPDLIIMDLMLPGEDGLSLTRRLKASGNIPIIMLTARGEEIDRIIGLEIGADDYLPKPFNPRELLARIKAVMRRNTITVSQTGPDSISDDIVHFNGFALDISRMKLTRDGDDISLTTGDLDLLAVLARNPGKVLSRDYLMDQISGHDRNPFDRSIDVRITRLRKKIEQTPSTPQIIHTVWGKGYRFTPDNNTQ